MTTRAATHRPDPRRPSPFAGFRKDHRRVLARIAVIERSVLGSPRLGAQGAARLRPLIALLERQFSSHMAAEEALLYPWLGVTLPECRLAIEPLTADHVEMRSLLASLAARVERPADRARDERVRVELRDLIDLLRLHIRHEEQGVFDVAERVLRPGEADDLRRRLEHFRSILSPKRERPTRVRATAPRRTRKRSS